VPGSIYLSAISIHYSFGSAAIFVTSCRSIIPSGGCDDLSASSYVYLPSFALYDDFCNLVQIANVTATLELPCTDGGKPLSGSQTQF
jgi:hypothetical protein